MLTLQLTRNGVADILPFSIQPVGVPHGSVVMLRRQHLYA